MEKESNIDASQLVDELSRESSKLDGCKLFLKTKGGMRTSEEKALRGIHDSIERIRKTQVELDTVCNDLIVEVRNNISGHESEINKFLEECGYPYR